MNLIRISLNHRAIMRKYVLKLQEVDRGDINLVGSKGANLGEMTKANFPIPPGFCITVLAYQHFIQSVKISLGLEFILKECDFEEVDNLRDKAERIRELIVSNSLPLEIKEAIRSAYRELETNTEDKVLVVVRSSSSVEDLSQASFAGQYDTFLNVWGEEELLLSVKRCWASLWTERAIAYRYKHNLDHLKMLSAVVVQQMIPSEVSGVIFTANPLNNRLDEIVIDASWGLGEAIVSGKVTPDNYILDKKRMRIKSKLVNSKEVMTVGVSRGDILNVGVPRNKRKKQALANIEILWLAQLATEVEEYYGTPLDIEWGYYDGEFYILQARPITTLKVAEERDTDDELKIEEKEEKIESTSGAEEDRTIWTNSNVGEALPGVMTPFSWSFISVKLFESNMKRGFEVMGIKKPDDPLVSNINGRLYINLTAVMSVFSQIPGLSPEVMLKIGGGPVPKDIDFPVKISSRLGFLCRLPLTIPRLIYMAINLPNKAQMIAPCLKEELRKFKLDLSQLPPIALLDMMDRLMQIITDIGRVMLSCASNSVIFYGILSVITERWGHNEEGTLHNKLITGLSDLKSAQPAIELWKLSREAMRSYKVMDIILSGNDKDIIPSLEKSEEGIKFLKKCRGFLNEYGHRAIAEMELMNPRWREDPGFIFAILRNYLYSKEEADPLNFERRQREERIKTTRKLRKKLPWIKRKIFDIILRETQRYARLREYTRFYLVLCIEPVRSMVLEIGRRLVQKEVIDRVEDIFFLSYEEIIELLKNDLQMDGIIAEIEERRKEYEYNLNLPPPPDVIIGKYDPTSSEIEVEEEEGILEGLGSSFGKATGRARVILDPIKASELREGEILITPATDAGWTPLFAIAKAIVSDIGGPLSHSSVVAREYGIPAVVNVKRGTKVIKTGDIITVDGDRGRVYIERI